MTLRAGVVCLVVAAGTLLHAAAQQPAINSQLRHARGQGVVPVYEGWFEDAAGTVHASYGYVNLNLDEALDIPIGPDNAIAPGPADRGQPTHFLAGHQKGVFTVPLAAGHGVGGDRLDAERTRAFDVHTLEPRPALPDRGAGDERRAVPGEHAAGAAVAARMAHPARGRSA